MGGLVRTQHACIHTYPCIRIHTYVYTHKHAYIRITYIHIHTYTYTYIHTHTYVHRGKRLTLAAAGALAGTDPGDLREAFAVSKVVIQYRVIVASRRSIVLRFARGVCGTHF
jgi:hypothetical protein